ASDCPAEVDMAQYKSEVLHRTYKGKRRPISHYALGWLPRWARAITAVPAVSRLVNAVLGIRPVAKLVLAAGGMDPRRKMVSFAEESFGHWWRHRAPAEGSATPSRTSAQEDPAS